MSVTTTETTTEIVSAVAAVFAAPFNATTGQPYKGGNVIRLLEAEGEFGFNHASGWAGFHQWKDAGRVVRKGQHGTKCLRVLEFEEASGRKDTRPRVFTVFHFDQTDPITESGTAEPSVKLCRQCGAPLDEYGHCTPQTRRLANAEK